MMKNTLLRYLMYQTSFEMFSSDVYPILSSRYRNFLKSNMNRDDLCPKGYGNHQSHLFSTLRNPWTHEVVKS